MGGTMKRLAVSVCLGLCAVASAEPFDHYEEVKVQGQNDTAQPTKMPWCEAKYTRDSWDTGRIRRQIGQGNLSSLADAAAHLCEHRDDPTWQKQATYLVQAWMNRLDMVQADAEKDIARRIKVLDDEQANE